MRRDDPMCPMAPSVEPHLKENDKKMNFELEVKILLDQAKDCGGVWKYAPDIKWIRTSVQKDPYDSYPPHP